MHTINVLVISHLYPNAITSNSGIFVQKEVEGLLKRQDCAITLFTPVLWVPRLFWKQSRWQRYAEIPQVETTGEMERWYPRIVANRYMPKITPGYTLYFALRGLADRLHTQRRFDIIHGHTLVPDGYAALRLGHRWGVPVVCTSHGSDGNYFPKHYRSYRALAKRVISESDQIIGVSNALRRDLESLTTPRKPVLSIPYGVDAGKFTAHGQRALQLLHDWGIPPDAFLLLFVGNLKHDKGVYELFQAMESLMATIPDLYLVMVGDGPERSALEIQKQSSSHLSRIKLVGRVPHVEVSRWLASADLFVFPSYHEGMPNAVLEALASGLPVVASAVGGIPDIVLDGDTGLLIPPRDVDSLVDAVLRLYDDCETRNLMGANARSLIVRDYSWEKHVQEVHDVYKRLV